LAKDGLGKEESELNGKRDHGKSNYH